MKKKYFPPQCTVICIESGHLLAGSGPEINPGNGSIEKPIPDTPEEAGAKEWIFMDDSDIWD